MTGLPASARLVSDAVTDAVAAAGDADAFPAATARLVALDGEKVRVVLGTVVRLLLEESNPAGVDGETLRDTLAAVVTTHSVDPSIAAYVLLGAVGATDPETPPPPGDTLLPAAVLVTATLLDSRPLTPVLTAAFTDLHRAETLDYMN